MMRTGENVKSCVRFCDKFWPPALGADEYPNLVFQEYGNVSIASS